MHEIANYLIGHTGKSYRNEIESDLLACLFLVTVENITEKAENVYKLWKTCNVPPDKWDIYWKEIQVLQEI